MCLKIPYRFCIKWIQVNTKGTINSIWNLRSNFFLDFVDVFKSFRKSCSGSSRDITMTIEQKILSIKIPYRFCLKWRYPSKYKGNHKFHMKFKVEFFLVFSWLLEELSKMVGNNFVDIGRSSFSAIKHKKHGIETTGRLYTWNWKYCSSSSCCRAIIINARPSEQNILFLKIQYHFCLNRQIPKKSITKGMIKWKFEGQIFVAFCWRLPEKL